MKSNLFAFGVLASLLVLTLILLPTSDASLTRFTNATLNSPVNNTVLNANWTYISYNFSSPEDVNFTNCTLQFHVNSSVVSNVTMSNVTSNMTTGIGYCYQNITLLKDTIFGQTYNFSIYVMNSSGIMTTELHNILVSIDTTVPSLTQDTENQNTSTTGYLRLQTTLTEENPGHVFADVFYDDDSYTTYDLTEYNTTSKISNTDNYTRNIITPTIEGRILVRYWANDTATTPNIGYASTNHTGLVSYIRGSEWNQIVLGVNTSFNMTLPAALKFFPPTVNQISIFQNEYDHKNFTNYASSTPTTNNESLIWSNNASYVYNSGASFYFWRNYSMRHNNITLAGGRNMTSDTNLSVNKTAWNYYGVRDRNTANTTIYSAVAQGYNGTPATAGNITAVAWYNATADVWAGCTAEWTDCTGTNGLRVNESYIPRGSGVWVLVFNTNVSYFNYTNV